MVGVRVVVVVGVEVEVGVVVEVRVVVVVEVGVEVVVVVVVEVGVRVGVRVVVEVGVEVVVVVEVGVVVVVVVAVAVMVVNALNGFNSKGYMTDQSTKPDAELVAALGRTIQYGWTAEELKNMMSSGVECDGLEEHLTCQSELMLFCAQLLKENRELKAAIQTALTE